MKVELEKAFDAAEKSWQEAEAAFDEAQAFPAGMTGKEWNDRKETAFHARNTRRDEIRAEFLAATGKTLVSPLRRQCGN